LGRNHGGKLGARKTRCFTKKKTGTERETKTQVLNLGKRRGREENQGQGLFDVGRAKTKGKK